MPPTAAELGSAPHVVVAAPPSNDRREQAAVAYEEGYIGFKELSTVAKTEPYEGRFQRKLSWTEFYTKVDRPDLVERAQTRRLWSRGLLGAGIILSVGSLVALVAQSGVNANCSGTHCTLGGGGYIAGAALGAVGLAFTLGGGLMPLAVQPAWDARRLGAEYDWRLRHHLGL
jgi:hypothetical protein